MIEGLKDRDRVWQSDPSRVSGIAEEYSTKLFITSHPRSTERVLEAVDKVVTEDMANSLTQPYFEEEVRVALFSMHPSKARGSGGMSPFFFQKYWHIVRPDVTVAVLSVLHSGR